MSQLIKRATDGHAQVVTIHGKTMAVVVSVEEYARLTRHRDKLSASLLHLNLSVEDLDFSRSCDTERTVKL